MERTLLWGALLGLALGGACGAPEAFLCASDSQCSTGGVCDEPGFCSFPDETCTSGRRFGEHAGQGLANTCVMPVVAGTTTGATTTSGPAPGSEGTDWSGTSPVADDDTSTGSPMTTTDGDDGGSTSTDGTGTSGTTGIEVPEGLVAWFRFERALPSDGVVDSSGNALHGTCLVCPTLGKGWSGLGGDFIGNEDVVLPADPLLEPPTFTVAAWVLVDIDDIAIMHVVSKPIGPLQRNSYELFMLLSGGQRSVRFIVGNDTEFEAATTPLLEPGWHHLAGTYDGELPRVYLDGVLEDVGEAVMVGYDDTPARIGHDFDNLDIANQLEGNIDDVRIYDVALDDAALADLAMQP